MIKEQPSLVTDGQIDRLAKALSKQQPKPKSQALQNMLSGSAKMAGKLLEVKGKRLSLNDKIGRQDLYLGGHEMNKMMNPLGIAIERPMDLYTVAKPRMAQPNQIRQRTNVFGASKLRLW